MSVSDGCEAVMPVSLSKQNLTNQLSLSPPAQVPADFFRTVVAVSTVALKYIIDGGRHFIFHLVSICIEFFTYVLQYIIELLFFRSAARTHLLDLHSCLSSLSHLKGVGG